MTLNFELRNYKKKDGTQPLRLRINIDSKQAYLNTGVAIDKTNWNSRKELVRKLTNEDFINDTLDELKKEIERLFLTNNHVTAKRLTELYKIEKSGANAPISFYEYFDERIEMFNNKKSFNQARRMQSVKNKLVEYKPTLNWDDLTINFLDKYESHLFKNGNMKNTVAGNMAAIKSTVREAIKKKIATIENPFKYYKIQWVKSDKTPLSITEIESLEKLSLTPNSREEYARDMFLFAFYASGMRISDVAHIKWENIKDDTIVYTMNKSQDRAGSTRHIPLHKKLKGIIDKYTDKDKVYIFPVLYGFDKQTEAEQFKRINSCNAAINKNLKTIAEKANIKTVLTFHLSKHSFSDWAVKNDTDILIISKLLGHTKLSTTEHYLQDFYKKEEAAAINKLFE